MKQKYTLLISDMEINVITEESQESVEYIVGILDRKIREITLKSKRCSKNEAALLCALDLCAEKIAAKERADELENELEAAGENLKTLTEKIEMLQKNTDRLEHDNARLETENAKLRAVLDDMRDRGVRSADPAIEEPVGDIYAARERSDEQTEPAAEEEKAKVIPTGTLPSDGEQKKKNSRNRVGSMFDLLTFSDV